MSFIYPRTVSISRPNNLPGIGSQNYGGLSKSNETIILSGLLANIQENRQGGIPYGLTPSDSPKRAGWKIFIPKASSASLGSIAERDVVTDDLGKRYIVIAAYWNSLGYKLIAELEQA